MSHSYNDYSERQRLFAAAFQENIGNRCDFAFAYFLGVVMLAGLRVDEALQLRWHESPDRQTPWPWLDLKSWQIVIPVAGSPRQRNRYAPIIPQLARLLMQWPSPREGVLFPSGTTRRQIDDTWKRTVKRAGVKPIGMDELREETFTTMMRQAGLSEHEIREILGPEDQKSKLAPTAHARRHKVKIRV